MLMKQKSIFSLQHIVFVLFTCFFTLASSQSTTSKPQGHCSSYLNRYTSQDQCIYSFIVPKKDSDQCPGLAAQISDLKDQLDEMRSWKEGVDTNIRLLSNTGTTNINLGRCQAQANILTTQNNNLTVANNILREEKARYKVQVNQKSIQSQELMRQLEQIRLVHEPLRRNYSQLRNQFRAVQQRLIEVQSRNDRLNVLYRELANTKNCSDVNKHLPSCAVIKQWGYKKSGEAMIDPDGEGGIDPFLVYCDMDSDPSTGITVIKHDNNPQHPVYGCESAGCFSLPVNYKGVTLQQIEKLMDISLACEQHIRYDCFDSKLLKDNTAWWVSRRGERMRYWGGAAPGSNMCACGVDNSCVSPTEKCNCDSDRERWLYDEGMLRDKATLPVTNLNFGDVNQKAGEKGNVTLGPLRCKWNINISVPSCAALQEAGVTGRGLYLVDPDGEGGEPARSTLCTLPDSITGSAGNASSSGTVVTFGNPNEYRFTNCGKRFGNTGPTEIACNNTYRRTRVQVRVVDGRQIWKVPKSGVYRVRAKAPSGYHSDPTRAGRGGEIQAEFELRKDEVLWVIVGQKGNAHAGAGGSFVVGVRNTYTLTPLLAAGGGGSATATGSRPGILDASGDHRARDSSLTGRSAGRFGTGGDSGNGGLRGGKLTGPNTSGGGAGFNTNGAKSSDDRFTPLPTNAIKINSNLAGNLAPGTGGTYTYSTSSNNVRNLNGGFGGGGSASKNGPGGAGGYSGGGGGPANGYSGGGGSFVAPEGRKKTFQLNQNEEGEVKFIYLGPLPEAADT